LPRTNLIGAVPDLLHELGESSHAAEEFRRHVCVFVVVVVACFAYLRARAFNFFFFFF